MKYFIEVNNTQNFCYINAIDCNTKERIGKLCIEFNSGDSVRYKNICVGNNIGKIIYVITNISACGNGVATSMLNKAIELFNDYNLYLNVVPMPRQSENKKFKNKNGLMRFYKKFGFVHYTEDICVTTMFRKAYSLMAQQVSALD